MTRIYTYFVQNHRIFQFNFCTVNISYQMYKSEVERCIFKMLCILHDAWSTLHATYHADRYIKITKLHFFEMRHNTRYMLYLSNICYTFLRRKRSKRLIFFDCMTVWLSDCFILVCLDSKKTFCLLTRTRMVNLTLN